MTTIELHGLATRVQVRVLGSRGAELADALVHAWSRCLDPRGEEIDGGVIDVALWEPGEVGDQNAVVGGSNLDAVMQSITRTVTLANIKAQTGRLFMFHAGAVADPHTGRALAFAAAGGTGKTTLTRHLGLAGAGYLTDECFGFSADGRVRPYPKPLSVRPEGSTLHKHELSPDDLDLGHTPDEAHLARLVLLERDPTHARPTFESLDVISAIECLAPESSALSDIPQPLRTLAALIESRPPVVRLRYSEASEAVQGLMHLLQERP